MIWQISVNLCSPKLFRINLHPHFAPTCIQLFNSPVFCPFSGKYKRTSCLRKEHCIHSCSIYIISRIWNKKHRVHLSCYGYHLMKLYQQPGNKKDHVKQLWKWISIVHPSSLTLKSALPPLLAEAKRTCELKRIGIELVLYKAKLILNIVIFVHCSVCVQLHS